MKVDYPEEHTSKLPADPLAEALRAASRVRRMELVIAETLSPPSSPPSRALAELESRKAELLAAATHLTVSDQPGYEFAATLRQQVRKVSDTFESLLRPNIKRFDDMHTEALNDLKRQRKPLDEAERVIKRKQDDYNNNLLRIQREEKLRIEAAMEEARQRTLREEMETAAASPSPDHLDSVIERMAQPAITVPMIPVKAKAAGASGMLVKKFRMLDPAKLSPAFIMGVILAEIAEKGECAWLITAINREMRYRGKGAEETVGVGSIEYYEEISTGVRRG